MEDFTTKHVTCLLLAASSWLGVASIEAQTVQDNAWTSPTSGNWEDPDWSLGTLPGPNQAILLTNAGWKALAIGPNTSANYPQTMDMDSITVSSPTNSFNVLLLNYAGYQTPLTADTITLGSNTLMTILASMLSVTNTGDTNYGLEVGGTVNQGEFPAVSVGRLSLGNIGPGIYNLTNGTLTVVTGYVGGTFTGQFNQFGGYNSVSSLWIVGTNELLGQVGAGEYDLYDGSLGGVVELHNGGLLKQSGGVFVGGLWFDGVYELTGGSSTSTTMVVPASENDFYQPTHDAGEVVQTGGTNQTGAITLGGEGEGYDAYTWANPGSYVLSNGLLAATSISLDVGGSMTQTGGTFTNSGQLAVGANILYDGGCTYSAGEYSLQGGFLAEDSLAISGYFTQSGGTNQVAGTTLFTSIAPQAFGGHLAHYTLSDGLFTTSGVTVSNAVIYQSGGSLLTGNLGLADSLAPNYYFHALNGYVLSGGQLTVSSLQVAGYAIFRHQGGTLIEPGLLTLAGGLWDEQTSGQQFGPLQVSSAYNVTNSMVSLPASNSCTIHFGDSSAVAWTGGVTLIISNWVGSTQGGGQHQIIFGSNSSALTTAQLSNIVFTNPAGLPGGMYPARILPSGEIVPNTITPPLVNAPVRQANGTMDVLVSGDVGRVYGMLVSTDLVHWVFLSTQTNQSGTMTFQDPAAPGYPHRFYRAYVEQ